jgi:hypothetical protein
VASETKAHKAQEPNELNLIVSYLSYAMEDVRTVSDDAAYLLRLLIATLEEHRAATCNEEPQPALPH